MSTSGCRARKGLADADECAAGAHAMTKASGIRPSVVGRESRDRATCGLLRRSTRFELVRGEVTGTLPSSLAKVRPRHVKLPTFTSSAPKAPRDGRALGLKPTGMTTIICSPDRSDHAHGVARVATRRFDDRVAGV